MAGKPYMALYTGEWMKDERLSLCEPGTRGIFVDWLCSMHNGLVDRLTGTARQLGRLGRCNDAEALAALQDLQRTGTAEVSERDGIWTVISRFRRKLIETSAARKEAGSKGLAKRWQNADSDNEDVLKIQKERKRRVGALFRRRDSTRWSEKEEHAFAQVLIEDQDLAAVERYYAEAIPHEKDYRRRDLLTLLNNWPGEVDRARLRNRPVRTKPLCSEPSAPPKRGDTRTPEEIEASQQRLREQTERLRQKIRGEEC